MEDSLLDDPPNKELVQAVSVIGVNQLLQIHSCMFYKRGTIEHIDGNTETCTNNCNTTQVLKKKVKTTAKLFLATQNETHITVRAYDKALKQIAQCDQVTVTSLLNAPQFDVRFNDFHVVTNVTRPN